LPPVGCLTADGHPTGRGAFQPVASRLPEAVRGLHLGLCPRGQENNALMKKKIKFSSYIGKFRVEQSYMTNGLLIYGEIFSYFLIY
jgi:hypothetical protein